MKQILFLIPFVIFSFSSIAQQYSKSWKDIDYVGDNQVYHKLDIYLPKNEKTKYPVVVLIYGSAWLSNSSKGADMNTLGQALLNAGYAVVTPNHRTSMDAKFPAQVNDIKAVTRFIRGTADNYLFDTSFVGVTGSSSGGSLAAMMGTTRDVKTKTLGNISVDIEGNLGKYTANSSSVDAVVDWFGPTNMLVMDSCGGTDFIHNDAGSPASLYIGGPIQENKEKTLLASPTSYVDKNTPPFLIFHGDADRVVPNCQSKILYDCLQKAGVKSQFFLVPGGQHGPGVHTDTNIKKMVDFFNSYKITMDINPRNENNIDFTVYQDSSKILKILFNSTVKAHVVLDVFDLLGRKVSMLDFGEIKPGNFSKELNSAKYSAGTYLFSLKIGPSVSTKKIVIK